MQFFMQGQRTEVSTIMS